MEYTHSHEVNKIKLYIEYTHIFKVCEFKLYKEYTYSYRVWLYIELYITIIHILI